ncbi:MAG TPA: DUF2721 domain-containing protein [Verrucomicrobiae bacterium]|jgi:hypothetical protein|nr:DUF2721 domain-containing protein [Verrucomicrobiae bacterium]
MAVLPFNEIVPVLQVAIGPVILISGVGLLLLTMTNRLGRAIDRARHLAGEFTELAPEKRIPVKAQVDILYRRAKVLRASITFSVLSALLAAVLIIALFLTALMQWEQVWFISIIFIACMTSLVVSLLLFLGDIQLSLTALKLEVEACNP